VHWFVINLLLTCLLSAATDADRAGAEAQHNWPQWRGPLGTGVAPDGKPPVEWSDTKNIRWKTALPGKGHSTPIAWGERIYLTTAIPFGEPVKPRLPSRPGAHDNLSMTYQHEFAVLAVSRRDGKILWQQRYTRSCRTRRGISRPAWRRRRQSPTANVFMRSSARADSTAWIRTASSFGKRPSARCTPNMAMAKAARRRCTMRP